MSNKYNIRTNICNTGIFLILTDKQSQTLRRSAHLNDIMMRSWHKKYMSLDDEKDSFYTNHNSYERSKSPLNLHDLEDTHWARPHS